MIRYVYDYLLANTRVTTEHNNQHMHSPGAGQYNVYCIISHALARCRTIQCVLYHQPCTRSVQDNTMCIVSSAMRWQYSAAATRTHAHAGIHTEPPWCICICRVSEAVLHYSPSAEVCTRSVYITAPQQTYVLVVYTLQPLSRRMCS